MWKHLLLTCLLLTSVVLVSGCTQTADTTGQLTDKQAEDQAYNTIESELDQAIENITLDDLEGELLQ